MNRLEFSPFVEGDLDQIVAYIARDNPRRAVSFIQEVRVKFQDIQRAPLLYQLRPDIGEQARMVTVGHYAILFRLTGDSVRIERVVHGSRDLPGDFDPA